MSPLSDTTNIAPAVAGTDLFTHIRYMMITTIPSLIIALIVFLFAGFGGGASVETLEMSFAEGFGQAVQASFNIHAGLFIAPVVLIALIIKKVPAAPALFIGCLLGAVTAVVFQPEMVRNARKHLIIRRQLRHCRIYRINSIHGAGHGHRDGAFHGG